MTNQAADNVSEKASGILSSQVSERIPVDESFGNLMLVGLEEINLPESISLWPQGPGWKYLAISLLILGLYYLFKAVKRWQKNAYRRAALLQLTQIEMSGTKEDSLYRLAYLIKATALHLYPRTEIAALTGAAWFAYLNKNSSKEYFDDRCAELLGNSRYSALAAGLSQSDFKFLVISARQWIEQHEIPELSKHTRGKKLELSNV